MADFEIAAGVALLPHAADGAGGRPAMAYRPDHHGAASGSAALRQTQSVCCESTSWRRSDAAVAKRDAVAAVRDSPSLSSLYEIVLTSWRLVACVAAWTASKKKTLADKLVDNFKTLKT